MNQIKTCKTACMYTAANVKAQNVKGLRAGMRPQLGPQVHSVPPAVAHPWVAES